MNDEPKIVGRIAKHPRHDRWALFHASGELSNTFAADATRDDIVAVLKSNGLIVHPDNTVTRA